MRIYLDLSKNRDFQNIYTSLKCRIINFEEGVFFAIMRKQGGFFEMKGVGTKIEELWVVFINNYGSKS